MKKHILEFIKRGLMAAGGGPLVLAIVYGILGATGVIDAIAPAEVTKGIISITVMAFIAAGITMIYTVEQLPLPFAILLHAGVLYIDYLIMYLFNNWIGGGLLGIGIFTGIFIAGFLLVWLCVYLIEKRKTDKLNKIMGK